MMQLMPDTFIASLLFTSTADVWRQQKSLDPNAEYWNILQKV